MKALKVSVVLMGVLILAGLAVVAITVARRGSAPTAPAESSRLAPPLAPPMAGTAPAGFGEATVTIPAGFAPVETRAEGDRLLIRLEGPGHAARILVIDLRTGRALGTVVLAPPPP